MNTPTEDQVFLAVNGIIRKDETSIDISSRIEKFNRLSDLYNLSMGLTDLFSQMYKKSGATSLEEFKTIIELQLTFQ